MTSSVLYTQCYGDERLQPLVLLHGWGLNSDIWTAWAIKLSEHFYVTCVDFPGLGRSSILDAEYSLPEVSAAVMSAVSSHQPPAIWLGWSLGGLVAAQVAQNFPSRVKGLVTIATNPCFVAQAGWTLGMDEATFSQFETALQNSANKTLQRFASLMVRGDPQAREQLRILKSLLADTETEPSVDALSSTLSLLREDARLLFFNMVAPHEYWFSEHDALVNSAIIDTTGLAESVWLINDAGHLPFMSQQYECTKRLIAFASSLEATHG